VKGLAKKTIHEIYWIRAIACLSVVLIHAITRTIQSYELPELTVSFYQTIQMIIMYATPMFVLISEVILSHVYQNSLPKGFFKKRISFILIPYISIPFIYGIYHVAFNGFSSQQFQNYIVDTVLLTHWHGYFVIIIFQFYLLHLLFIKWFKNIPAWIVLLSSLMINVAYLYIANFTDAMTWPEELQKLLPYLKLPFLAWIFYFTVAFYIGKNLDTMKRFRRLGYPIALSATLISLSAVLYLYHSEIFAGVTSLHLGILFYTVSLFFFLFYFFGKYTNVPKWIIRISNYSFSIYLLHMLMIEILDMVLPSVHIGLFTILVFLGAVTGSMIFAWMLSKFPKSEFIVGQIRSVSTLKKKSKYENEKRKERVSAVS
jgi:probable poly-beta-1,6-N-acetyl-D-glucosamine export protein